MNKKRSYNLLKSGALDLILTLISDPIVRKPNPLCVKEIRVVQCTKDVIALAPEIDRRLTE